MFVKEEQPQVKSTKTSASESIAIFAVVWAMVGFFGAFAIGAYYGWLPALSIFLSCGVSALLIWLWSKAVQVAETTNELLKTLIDKPHEARDGDTNAG